ncbi:hypothetical protein ASF56_16260 [Methylobacterium sp. Leaf122]|nr:hypothetical protein ASF56_16260 [Methylobacterium sp. Leaf122]
MRPTPGFSSPHICELHDLRTKYTIDDLANFHEILDLREAAEDKARKHIEAERSRNQGRRVR